MVNRNLSHFCTIDTVNTATAIKFKKDLTYLIFLQVKELESAKLINLWPLLKQTKAKAQAGLAGVDLDCSPLIKLD